MFVLWCRRPSWDQSMPSLTMATVNEHTHTHPYPHTMQTKHRLTPSFPRGCSVCRGQPCLCPRREIHHRTKRRTRRTRTSSCREDSCWGRRRCSRPPSLHPMLRRTVEGRRSSSLPEKGQRRIDVEPGAQIYGNNSQVVTTGHRTNYAVETSQYRETKLTRARSGTESK